MLTIRQLSKAFDGKNILNDISLNVEYGEITIFLGGSGVGKSTLLRLICGLETLEGGEIHLNDEPLQPPKDVGMVFQQFNLFTHLSVQDNVCLALEKCMKKSRAEALKITYQLLEKYMLRDKAEMEIDSLSGGQKQRLALAQVLALQPRIICLDEPTSALDPFLTGHISSIISELASEKHIILIASHDTELLKHLKLRKARCSIHLMEQGKIVETAKNGEFFTQRDRYPLIDKFVSG